MSKVEAEGLTQGAQRGVEVTQQGERDQKAAALMQAPDRLGLKVIQDQTWGLRRIPDREVHILAAQELPSKLDRYRLMA
jgi:hypothetical protein